MSYSFQCPTCHKYNNDFYRCGCKPKREPTIDEVRKALAASEERVQELEKKLETTNAILDLTWPVVEYVVGHTPYEEELEALAKKAFFHNY